MPLRNSRGCPWVVQGQHRLGDVAVRGKGGREAGALDSPVVDRAEQPAVVLCRGPRPWDEYVFLRQAVRTMAKTLHDAKLRGRRLFPFIHLNVYILTPGNEKIHPRASLDFQYNLLAGLRREGQNFK